MEQRVEIQERWAVECPFCYDSKVVCLTADVRVPCRVKLANELAAAEQAVSWRAAVLIPITSRAPSRPHSSGPLPLQAGSFRVCGRSAVLWRSSV